MTSPAALQWLCEEFEPALRRYQRQARARSLDENWHGPSVVRPMIQLRSLHGRRDSHDHHPGRLPRPGPVVAMTTTTADYYALLGVEPGRHHGADQVGLPQAGQAVPPGHQPQRRDAADRFREITEAYDTLTDPEPAPPLRPAPRHPFTGTAPGPDAPATDTTDGPPAVAGPGPGRHLAGHPRAGTGNPGRGHHHRQRHRTRQPRWGHHAPGRWNVGRRAARRGHDQRRRTPPHPARRPRHVSCTKPPTPWPTPAASRTPPARAATTTSTSRPTPNSSA